MLGILLCNLGSPKSPDPQDVKVYLKQFLNDPYVIDLPAPLRWFLVNVLILNSRPKKSAEAYAKIWTERGSPLVDLTARLADQVRKHTPVPVAVGMRYGEPSLEAAVNELISAGVTEIVFLPLYPQYSYAASETAIVEFETVLKRRHPGIGHYVIEDFFRHPAYVEALARSIEPELNRANPDLLLLSYHGIPEKQRHKTRNKADYREHCLHTTKLLQGALKFPSDRIDSSFQSRLGPTKWIEPYTDHLLQELPRRGVKKLAVASPSFTVDCLETLEEINLRYREQFLSAGGEAFEYIPCLNDSDSLACALVKIVRDHIPKGKSL